MVRDLWWAWGLVGLAAGLLLGRTSGPRPARDHGANGRTEQPAATSPSTTPAAPRPGPPPGPAPTRADPELVEDLILGHDLARDEALAGHLEQVLGHLGVVQVAAVPGMPFDGQRHRAVGTEASDGSTDGPVIVRVERPGWRTGEDVLRTPEVIVTRPPERSRAGPN